LSIGSTWLNLESLESYTLITSLRLSDFDCCCIITGLLVGWDLSRVMVIESFFWPAFKCGPVGGRPPSLCFRFEFYIEIEEVTSIFELFFFRVGFGVGGSNLETA